MLIALSIHNRPTKRKKMNALRMPRFAIFVSLAGVFAWAGPVAAGGLFNPVIFNRMGGIKRKRFDAARRLFSERT